MDVDEKSVDCVSSKTQSTISISITGMIFQWSVNCTILEKYIPMYQELTSCLSVVKMRRYDEWGRCCPRGMMSTPYIRTSKVNICSPCKHSITLTNNSVRIISSIDLFTMAQFTFDLTTCQI